MMGVGGIGFQRLHEMDLNDFDMEQSLTELLWQAALNSRPLPAQLLPMAPHTPLLTGYRRLRDCQGAHFGLGVCGLQFGVRVA